MKPMSCMFFKAQTLNKTLVAHVDNRKHHCLLWSDTCTVLLNWIHEGDQTDQLNKKKRFVQIMQSTKKSWVSSSDIKMCEGTKKAF